MTALEVLLFACATANRSAMMCTEISSTYKGHRTKVWTSASSRLQEPRVRPPPLPLMSVGGCELVILSNGSAKTMAKAGFQYYGVGLRSSPKG